MKYKFSFLLLFLSGIFFFSSCKKNALKVINDNSIPLYNCSEKAMGMPYICFDSLINDSRCPVGAECIWQGTAIIQASFHENGNSHTFKISLQGYPTLGNTNDTTINGYRIIFTDLEPHPEVNKPVPRPQDIRATFSISH